MSLFRITKYNFDLKNFLPFLLTIGCCLFSLTAFCQLDAGLKAYYSFDNCDLTDETGNGSDGTLYPSFNTLKCNCGVSGNAIEFEGDSSYVVFTGLVNTYFNDNNFSVSFYYKSYGAGFQTSLISKREMCNQFEYLDIRTKASQSRIVAEMYEDNLNKVEPTGLKDPNTCWQHVVVTRENTKAKIYINGVLEDEETSPFTLDIDNNAVLSISDSPCIGQDGTTRFKGLIDELRVYNRALNIEEVLSFYVRPDQIATRDTVIFLGNYVIPQIKGTCATNFSWFPTDGVSDPTIADPTITPDSTTTYTLSFTDPNGCVAKDTLLIKVVDPATIDCDQISLPSAFSPNADNLNDKFAVSNPQVIPEFISLELYDRWGTRVFYSEDAFEGWDGTFNGRPVDPAVYIYQLQFNCREESLTKTGTVTLIK